MKKKRIFEAVVTIQGARIRPQSLTTTKPKETANPVVHILVMVTKGDKDVTVPTNCVTETKRRTNEPLWNETFSFPVLPSSDVLVFRVFHDPTLAPRRRSGAIPLPTRHSNSSAPPPPLAAGASGDSRDIDDDDNDRAPEDGRVLVGFCLLPVAHFSSRGEITRHKMDIFPRPNAPTVGRLYVAARIRQVTIDLLEKCDLMNPQMISQYHSSRLSAISGRFLGIGELAAFLFEEGYSDDPDDNWQRALTLLAEQLAYRIWETTGSTDDKLNFEYAKKKVETDGGLWDGV